jgi:hypothetical protein
MSNQFENFNNLIESQNALDKLTILNNYQAPNDDVGIRPINASQVKGKPAVVVKKRKNGKIIVYTHQEILKLEIEKNFRVGLYDISKEEQKQKKKISKHLKEIVKNITGSSRPVTKKLSKKTINKVLVAGALLNKKSKKITSKLIIYNIDERSS